MSNLRPLVAALALMLGAGCSSPRYEVARPVSHALERPGETFLGRTQAAQLAATPGQSGFHLLVSGQEAFLARAAMAEAAERTLDLQYYIVGEDATATLLLQRGARATAQRAAPARGCRRERACMPRRSWWTASGCSSAP